MARVAAALAFALFLQAAHGYQVAPMGSCGGAYRLVSNTVSLQRYPKQQPQSQQERQYEQQQQLEQLYYDYPRQQFGGPPTQQQYRGRPLQQQYFRPSPQQQLGGTPRWPTSCRFGCYCSGNGRADAGAGLVKTQKAREILVVEPAIQTPTPIMQNPEDSHTDEVVAGDGQVWAFKSVPASAGQPQRYNQPQQHQLQQQQQQQQQSQQQQRQPQPWAQRRFSHGVLQQRRPSPPSPATPALPEDDNNNDDGFFKTFILYSVTDPIAMNSAAAMIAAAPDAPSSG